MKNRFLTHYLTLFLFINMGMFFNAYADAISAQEKLAHLETETSVRLGVYALNTANNQSIHFQAEKHFPLKSTVKLMVVAATLHQSMTNSHLLQQKIHYKKEDLVSWSPITEKNLDKEMTISELCAATMIYSDNTASNLLIKQLGGLNTVTSFARSIGDNTFRLDHFEPEMNSNPNNLEDTETPKAMVGDLQKLILGNVLGSTERRQLIAWMKDNTTGDDKIRAGVPTGWIVADKTGHGSYGISNDIGIIWPPNSAPIIIAIYTVQNKKDAIGRSDVIAKTTRIVIQEFSNQKLYPTKPETQVLQRIDLSGTNYQVGMGTLGLSPNEIKNGQVQTGPEVVYVLSGEIMYFAKDKPARTIKADESYQIPAGEIHFSKAGPNGAKVLATWVLEKGKPFAIPIPYPVK
jgi:beta-lactamase class A